MANLSVSVDVKNMDIFKELLKVTAFMFERADKDTQLEVMSMMEHGDLIVVSRGDDS